MRVVLLLLAFPALISLVCGHTAEEWKSRVIYQLLTDRFAKSDSDESDSGCGGSNYCGGTFKGIINKLDYIQGLGTNAIWISPVIENTPGGYHGYWAKNIYNINSYFGSADDLKDLVNQCHKRDIWVLVDVVANHMGYPPGCPGCSRDKADNFSGLTPFNQAEHYHDYCDITDWGNQKQVEICRLAGLPDLNQQNDYVKNTLLNWIKNLTAIYGFDGIRIDTIPEVPKDFWYQFGTAAGVFQIGEVDNGDPKYVGPYQGPLSAVLNYPMYWSMRDAYQNKKSFDDSIKARLVEEPSLFKDMSVLGGFIDNHDNNRFLNINSDWTALKNALAYNFFAKWIPILYYGTEQAYNGGSDPANRESLWPNYNTKHFMYLYISQLLKFRKSLGEDLINSAQKEKWSDSQFYAFTRCTSERLLVATTNQGSGSTVQRTIPNLPYADGTVLQNILDSNDKVTTSGGKVAVGIQNGQPKIYHVISTTGLRPANTRSYHHHHHHHHDDHEKYHHHHHDHEKYHHDNHEKYHHDNHHEKHDHDEDHEKHDHDGEQYLATLSALGVIGVGMIVFTVVSCVVIRQIKLRNRNSRQEINLGFLEGGSEKAISSWNSGRGGERE